MATIHLYPGPFSWLPQTRVYPSHTHRCGWYPALQPPPQGNMTSEASEAELRRMLSGEKDLELNYGHAPATPPNTGDTGCLVHVGAHFGPSNDSCPNYPDCVELEGEAARQPDSLTPRGHHAHRVQHSPQRGPNHPPPTPTLTPKQKGPYLSRPEYALFERLRLEEEARGQRFSK